MPFLRRLGCAQSPPFLFLGAINWAAVVPRAAGVGIRLDRCGFAWDLGGALANFGKSFKAWGGGEACDRQGAVLPVPYAIGAGYIFSAALLQWVATSREANGAPSAFDPPSSPLLPPLTLATPGGAHGALGPAADLP